MKILFSPKKKLIKLAEDERPCRLCGKTGENPGSIAVVPYSLSGEPTANKIRRQEVSGCLTCNNNGTVKSTPPTYTECKTCRPGSITTGGVGQGAGVYRPNICPSCFNKGTKTTPVHGGGVDEVEELPCPTCNGNKNKIPLKNCPTCIGKGTDKPGFVQSGESQHNVICPTCNGSKKRTVASPYTPILQVKCPHNQVDTRTKPNAAGASDRLGPYDKNYFEGQRLLPLKLLWGIRGVGPKYHHERNEDVKKSLFDGSTREVGAITPPIPPVQSNKEPNYIDFFSRPDLLDPDRGRTASNSFKRIKNKFNSKIAASEDAHGGKPADESGEWDDFFGKPEESSKANDNSVNDFLPEGLSLNTLPPSRRTLSPEQQKRLHGGPITVRQVDESDLARPFLKNPTKAIEHTKSMLKDQKYLSEKRDRMSKMFKGMSDIEKEPDENVREKKRNLDSRGPYRNWRDNLQTVSENLDVFGQMRSILRKKLSPVIGKDMDPDIATALTAQQFREGKQINNKKTDLSQHRMGITDPMPYFKNDENWRETHSGLGCDHDPGEHHEPDVGCIVDYFNSPNKPKGGVTTGVNQRLVTGKYSREDGKTILQTVGARLKRPTESGVAKQDLRGSTPQWTPENFGRTVELPSENAICVPNKIQREHYVVNHTIEPSSERAESISLPEEETGVPGLKPEPLLSKEKIKFPEHIRSGGPASVYVGNPLYQLNNPFSSQEVERGMWANNPAVQHLAKQIKNGKRPDKFKPYTPEPKFNSQQMKTRPGLTGPPPAGEHGGIDFDELNIDDLFNENPPKTSKKENELNPVEENADDTYDTDKKLKVQKMQRTQVHMVEPTNPSEPDITPDVPLINYN